MHVGMDTPRPFQLPHLRVLLTFCVLHLGFVHLGFVTGPIMSYISWLQMCIVVLPNGISKLLFPARNIEAEFVDNDIDAHLQRRTRKGPLCYRYTAQWQSCTIWPQDVYPSWYFP